MFHRTISVVASTLMLSGAAVALSPAAQAAPETYTGHLQVIESDTILGCVTGDSNDGWTYAGRTTDPDSAWTVAIADGPRQNMTIDGASNRVVSAYDFSMFQGQNSSYTVLTAGAPLPAGSVTVQGRQTAIWSIDPTSQELSAEWIWNDGSSSPIVPWRSTLTLQGLAIDHAWMAATYWDVLETATSFRIGSACSGPALADTKQAIAFTSTAPTTAHPGQTYTVEATGGASGNPVTFTSADEGHCTVDGSTVTFGAPGTCTIKADQAGATGYSAARTATQDITVTAIPSAVELSLDDSSIFDGQAATAIADVSVTTGSLRAAGGSVQFAIDGTDVGSPVAVDADGRATSPDLEGAVGTHEITATYEPASANYAGSTDTATLTVKAKATQAITFTSDAPASAHPGQTYTVEATGGASAKPVTFSSATADVCEIDGSTVTFTKPGTCTIAANQAGATGHSPAPTATQDITVTAIPSEVALSLDLETVFDGQAATATADVSVTSGSIGTARGSVQFAIDGTAVGSPVDIDADGRATSPEIEGAVGTHEITATYVPADANYAGSTDAATLTVTAKAPQAVTFTSSAPSPAYPGATYTVATTGGGSGNPVTLSTSSEHCTIDGSTVTFGTPGTCTVTANQAGAAGFTAAPTVTQDITVSAIPSTVTVGLGLPSVVTGQRTTATADVTVAAGSLRAAGGTVQFAVDGTDVGSPVEIDADGHAVSPELGGPVGAHQVTATYVPADRTNYVGATSSTSLTVAAASTITKVSVTASELTATVAPVAPGTGTPTGEVTFHVDGEKVGTSTLAGGVATLAHAVPTDATHAVSAEYLGDAGFTGSSASTSRANPGITAKVTASQKPRNGWYRAPVTVSFACDTKGAELTQPCPKPVTVSKQGAGSVTRTIHSTDGGIATVTARFAIDRTAPKVSVKGVKAGRAYFDAPKPKCIAKDSISGVAKCSVSSKRSGNTVVVTAKATDVAGNVTTRRVSYRLASFTIRGATKVGGAYRVKHGKTYTLVVKGAKARYVYATPAPGTPHRGSVPFRKAGKNTWSLGVTMSMSTSGTRSWNLGYTQGGKLHVIKVKVSG